MPASSLYVFYFLIISFYVLLFYRACLIQHFMLQYSISQSLIELVQLFQLVTAFAVSATASNWDRTGKPFNPLLGETYELDR